MMRFGIWLSLACLALGAAGGWLTFLHVPVAPPTLLQVSAADLTTGSVAEQASTGSMTPVKNESAAQANLDVRFWEAQSLGGYTLPVKVIVPMDWFVTGVVMQSKGRCLVVEVSEGNSPRVVCAGQKLPGDALVLTVLNDSADIEFGSARQRRKGRLEF